MLLIGVHPLNQAKCTQMEGRVNRATCERLHRTHIAAMAGLTEIIHKYQRNAKNLEIALSNLSKNERLRTGVIVMMDEIKDDKLQHRRWTEQTSYK